MLAAWEESRAEQQPAHLDRQRFYDVRKRPTGKPRISTGGITPVGEAVLARDLGLDTKVAAPIPEKKVKYAWVPTGEPGSYKGSREAYMPLD